MESRRQLDTFGAALLALVLLLSAPAFAADPFEDAVALARLGRLDEARAALLAGHRARPNDQRFLIELGGVAFKQKRYGEAAAWLRRALRLEPDDAYATDFLAAIYFLQGNLEAALKYWNRIEKPRVQTVRVDPELRADPVLLDRAFAFAPTGTLRLPDYLATNARLRALGIFSAASIRLDAREDGAFDATLAARERNGWGSTREALLSTLRGVFYQTVHPEYFNLSQSAINISSMVRWDPEKRRMRAAVSSPRYSLGADLRDENWDLRPGALNLRKSAVQAGVSSVPGAGWLFSTGAELSHRKYLHIVPGPRLPDGALLAGFQLKHTMEAGRELWRAPEYRMESALRLRSETARIWSAPSRAFERLQISSSSRWLPRMTGDDYAIRQHIAAGKIFGGAPFDELFMLGLERDNDLWLRAHIGTRGGRKGNAPLCRSYWLANWDIDKNVYNNGLIGVKLSPFLDAARTGKWLWDTGVQAKLQVLGVRFAFIYGKDLRSGNNTFYITTAR